MGAGAQRASRMAPELTSATVGALVDSVAVPDADLSGHKDESPSGTFASLGD
jgi:hypothetical protein